MTEEFIEEIEVRSPTAGPHGGFVLEDYTPEVRLRNLIVTGPVDESMSSQICRNLFMLNAEDPTTPIAMYINTYGGSAYDMMAIYDVMQFIKAPIYTVGFGKVMSAGSLILAAGKPGHRYCLPHTSLMIHRIKGGTGGTTDDIDTSLEHIKELEKDMSRLLRKHSKITQKQIKEFLTGPDKFMKPKEALKLGIIDKVSGVIPRIMC